jgi:hypothetical protein
MSKRMPPTRAAGWWSPRSAPGVSPSRSPEGLISGRSARSGRRGGGLPIPSAALSSVCRICCASWDAISVVAGARKHRNRLASPSRWMPSGCRASSPLGPGSTDLIAWELSGMDLGISWENGNRTGFPPGPHSVELAALQRDLPAPPAPDAGQDGRGSRRGVLRGAGELAGGRGPPSLRALAGARGETEQALVAFRQARRPRAGQCSRTGGARAGLGRARARPVSGAIGTR